MKDMDNFDRFRSLIEERDLVEVNIIRVAKHGKQSLRYVVKELLKKQNAEYLGDDIFSSLIELIFNAIKANYKFVFMKEEFRKILRDKGMKELDIEKEVTRIAENKELLLEYARSVDMKKIQKKVRETLTKEGKITKIKEQAEKENRKLTGEEKETIADALKIAKEAHESGIKVYLRISSDKESIIIDIINTSPILEKDLDRINAKRQSFKEYKDRGEEQNFYIENIDETESAGFGAAMIDARLYALNVVPRRHYDIWGYKDKTVVTVTFPFKTDDKMKPQT